jgi:hypothetical protein
MFSWWSNGWDGHYYCILLSQLYTDAGVPFTPAGGQTCLTLHNAGFDAIYSQSYGSWAVYGTHSETSPKNKAPAGSQIEVVHGIMIIVNLLLFVI